eukprot:scaffold357_cov239-Pinguiococcus_pyrenoidosus.AAC.15
MRDCLDHIFGEESRVLLSTASALAQGSEKAEMRPGSLPAACAPPERLPHVTFPDVAAFLLDGPRTGGSAFRWIAICPPRAQLSGR